MAPGSKEESGDDHLSMPDIRHPAVHQARERRHKEAAAAGREASRRRAGRLLAPGAAMCSEAGRAARGARGQGGSGPMPERRTFAGYRGRSGMAKSY